MRHQRDPLDRQPLLRLGGLACSDFVRRYWQRAPLYIPQALAGFSCPIDRPELLDLAAAADVESRLVSADPGAGALAGRRAWKLRHGPFARGSLPSLRRPAWTLLVQGVDRHSAKVAALAARFRFLPAARFDDVMVSYATDGGGVGPHVDQYDVFLLQARGRRRWRIARHFDATLVPGLPLQILRHFRHESEWELAAGDALYLPPGVAHEGVALGECVTISIGFRLPRWQEILDAWHDQQAEESPRMDRLRDRIERPTKAPARLPEMLIAEVRGGLARAAPSGRQAACVLLGLLTEPKPIVVFAAPRSALRVQGFGLAASGRGVELDCCSRMLYARHDLAINGEVAALDGIDDDAKRALRRLADHGHLPAATLAALAADPTPSRAIGLLHAWYRNGWLHLAA